MDPEETHTEGANEGAGLTATAIQGVAAARRCLTLGSEAGWPIRVEYVEYAEYAEELTNQSARSRDTMNCGRQRGGIPIILVRR